MSQRYLLKHSKSILGAAVVVLAVSGCEHLQDDLRVNDHSTPSYQGSIVIRPESMEYSKRRTNRGGFEFGYERYRGEDRQQLSLDHFIELTDGSIFGPQTVTSTAKVEHGHVAYNHLFVTGNRHFEFEPALGLSYDETVFTAQGSLPGSRLLTEEVEHWGALLSFTPRYFFNEYVGIEGRLSLGFDFDGSEVFNGAIGAVFRPTPAVAVRVGYYNRDHEIHSEDSLSDFETDFAGFNAKLTIAVQ